MKISWQNGHKVQTSHTSRAVEQATKKAIKIYRNESKLASQGPEGPRLAAIAPLKSLIIALAEKYNDSNTTPQQKNKLTTRLLTLLLTSHTVDLPDGQESFKLEQGNFEDAEKTALNTFIEDHYNTVVDLKGSLQVSLSNSRWTNPRVTTNPLFEADTQVGAEQNPSRAVELDTMSTTSSYGFNSNDEQVQQLYSSMHNAYSTEDTTPLGNDRSLYFALENAYIKLNTHCAKHDIKTSDIMTHLKFNKDSETFELNDNSSINLLPNTLEILNSTFKLQVDTKDIKLSGYFDTSADQADSDSLSEYGFNVTNTTLELVNSFGPTAQSTAISLEEKINARLEKGVSEREFSEIPIAPMEFTQTLEDRLFEVFAKPYRRYSNISPDVLHSSQNADAFRTVFSECINSLKHSYQQQYKVLPTDDQLKHIIGTRLTFKPSAKTFHIVEAKNDNDKAWDQTGCLTILVKELNTTFSKKVAENGLVLDSYYPLSILSAGDATTPRVIAMNAPKEHNQAQWFSTIWDQGVSVIQQVTPNVEWSGNAHKPKCAPYIPGEGQFTQHGDILVKTTKTKEVKTTDNQLFYKVSTLELTKGNETKTVQHFLYTRCPDHNVPKNPTELLVLQDQVDKSLEKSKGSLLIHCSASIGRTGLAFMVRELQTHIDAVKEGREDAFKSLDTILSESRQKRPGLVQEKCQYEALETLYNEMLNYQLAPPSRTRSSNA